MVCVMRISNLLTSEGLLSSQSNSKEAIGKSVEIMTVNVELISISEVHENDGDPKRVRDLLMEDRLASVGWVHASATH